MSMCVVHLVRALNGLTPFMNFIRSYTQYRPGQKHDLLIIFKGFGANHGLSEYKKILNGIEYKTMFVQDWGYDIRPYFTATKRFDYQYFCFLNSFSTILDHDWLYKMNSLISAGKVGLVGATGSYESVYSNLLMMEKTFKTKPLYHKTQGYLRRQIYRLYFDPFPNYHIRTNAFIISRPLMLKIRCGNMLRKLDALRFESGKNSLTRQIMNMGFRVLMVGKNGNGYEKEEWFNNNIFFQNKQGNLLVADNKTRVYSEGTKEQKKILSKMAWGDEAVYL